MLAAAWRAVRFWAAIAGYLKAYRGINEVIVTLLLNYVGIHIVSYRGGRTDDGGRAHPIPIRGDSRLACSCRYHASH